MSPRTAHAHDIVVEYIWDRLGPTWEFWHALKTIIDAPKKDWAECDKDVRAEAIKAVKSGDLNGRPRKAKVV